MKILLDTNAYTALKKGRGAVADRVRRSERVLLSTIVVGEPLFGFHHGARLEQNRSELDAFLGSPHVELIPVTMVTADRFGRIASALRARGTPIPTNDIWIAAHTMETGAELLSFDRHFERVAGLVWTCLED